MPKALALMVMLFGVLAGSGGAVAGPADAGGSETKAKAKTARRMAVVVLPAEGRSPEQQQALWQAAQEAALEHSGSGQSWVLLALNPRPPERGEGETIAEVKRKVDEGRQAYRFLKLPEARAVFEQAHRLLQEVPPARCERKVVSDLFFYWARAALDDGDDKTAGQLLRQVDRFDEKALPDPATMPPNLVATWDVALEERKSMPRARVSLHLGPGAGSLFVDCAERAAGEIVLEGPAGGEFWVAATIDGGSFHGRYRYPSRGTASLIVWSGQPGDARRVAELYGKLDRQTLASLSAPARQALDGLAAATGAELLLLAEADGAGARARLQLYLPQKGLLGSPVETALAEPGAPDAGLGAGMAKISAQMGSPGVLAALQGESDRARQDPDGATRKKKKGDGEAAPPWYRTWWFWTATGAVVAGGVLTAVLLATSGGTAPSGNVVLTVSPPR